MQALRPWDRDPVPIGRRHQAERRLLRRRAVAFEVEIHVPAELAVPPRILTWHAIDGFRRACIDRRPLPSVDEGEQPPSLARIGGAGGREGPAAGGG